MDKEVTQKWRHLIVHNKIKQVLNEMYEELKGQSVQNDLILIYNRFNSLNDEILRGTIKYEDQTITQNRIVSSLLELLNNIDEDLVEVSVKNLPNISAGIKSIVQEISDVLKNTYIGFIAQAAVRNKLVDNIIERLKITDDLEYESFFTKYYSDMDENELRLHKTIRFYTENILSKENRKVFNLIKENPALKREIPRLQDLEKHLMVWLAKYDGVFQTTESMCLVYAGVEENVPFPHRIEQDLQDYLDRN